VFDDGRVQHPREHPGLPKQQKPGKQRQADHWDQQEAVPLGKIIQPAPLCDNFRPIFHSPTR
jgi:hypothetical protein